MTTFPRSEFADATLSRPGEVRVVEGTDSEGHRHVLILAGIRARPWTAFARAKRATNGQPYSAWKAATHDAVKAALAASGTAMYPRDARLGLAMSFGARLAKVGGERRATSVLDFDLRNLEKATEDCLKGLLYADDDQVRYSGPGHAVDTAADFVIVHAWEGGMWQAEWAAFTVPEDGMEVTA